MKKVLSLILALVLVLTLSACGNNETSQDTHISTDVDFIKHVIFGIHCFPCITRKEEKQFVTVTDLPIIKLLSSFIFKPLSSLRLP